MRVPVKGIQPGEYAEMIRTENEWTIQIGDSVVSVIPNKPLSQPWGVPSISSWAWRMRRRG